jgi:glutathione S-transferase
MIRIWGRANSVNVQKVLWCCDELGVAFQRIDAGGEFGVVNDPAYRKLNPNGLVPAIEDAGFVLWESNAIVRYLAAKHSKLWPQDPARRADADRWMDWQLGALWPALRPLFWGLVRTPPEKRDLNAIEAARLQSAELFQILDGALAGSEFAAGAEFSVGDIALGVAAQRWMALPIERPSLPSLEAWYFRLCQRPAFQKNVLFPLS